MTAAVRSPGQPVWVRPALADPSQLPEGELDDAVEYSEESDEKFLRSLRRDLYGDEPVAGP